MLCAHHRLTNGCVDLSKHLAQRKEIEYGLPGLVRTMRLRNLCSGSNYQCLEKNFFTVDTFGTVAGSTGIIVVVTNTVRAAFSTRHALIPVIVSLLVGFAGAALANKLGIWPEWLLAFFNSCLLFCTATGAAETIAAGTQGHLVGESELQSATPVRFFSSWFRDK
jgi:hypothetical protein